MRRPSSAITAICWRIRTTTGSSPSENDYARATSICLDNSWSRTGVRAITDKRSSSANRLLAADPWREDVLRILMAVRYAAGDSAGALAECARFSKRLEDEMGVGPMPETIAVRDAILANAPIPGDIGERPADGARNGSQVRPFLTFAGRRAELERLHALWRRAARGSGTAVLVAGEGGVGKTRLCAELAQMVEAEGGRVFAGGTSATESIPYQCLLEAIRSALPVVASGHVMTPIRAAVLARVLPELRESAAADEPAPLSADRETARLLDALAETVAGLARPRPLLLILEDLHWAGNATLEAFARVTRHAPAASMLVVATYRDEEAGPSHGLRAIARQLRTEGRLTTIDLVRLEREDVADIVAGLEGFAGGDAALVDRLYRHTEGNPLFLSETIAEVLERRFVDRAAVEGVDAGITRIIASRTARLGDDARAVAEVAAVAGHGCSAELVQENYRACAGSALGSVQRTPRSPDPTGGRGAQRDRLCLYPPSDRRGGVSQR